MSYGGTGAHAQSDAIAAATAPIVGEIAAARKASSLRWRLTFIAVWLAIIIGVILILMAADAWDWDFVFTSGPVIIREGVWVTVVLSVSSIIFASILALFGALGRISTNPVLNGVASFYVSLIRGTPLLVQIAIIYFALPQVGVVLPAFVCGLIALSMNYGAYMTEIFRAGIQAVPRGQREAARALGMPERKVFRRIVMPQAFRIVTPAIGNEFIAMLKDSALVSIISVHETLFWAQRLGRSALEPMTALLIAAIVYWVLTIMFTFLQAWMERRLARSDR
jgi:polar amino acid transport system permease protein